MKIVSVFNNVLGPVMRGPSSSHTAASYHIGKLARDILGVTPKKVRISFDNGGSYGKVYAEQGADKAFVAGLMDWDLLDDAFHDALSLAAKSGAEISFGNGDFPGADHPNWVAIELEADDGRKTRVIAKSIGGGSVLVTSIDGHGVSLRGDAWVTLLRPRPGAPEIERAARPQYGDVSVSTKNGETLVIVQNAAKPADERLDALRRDGYTATVVRPVFFPIAGEPLFRSAAELADYATSRNISVGEAALAYECALLGLSREDAMREMRRRYNVMKSACERAIAGKLAMPMQLLHPTAQKIMESGRKGTLPFFGLHTRAAIRAMAVMHANGAMDVVCAAPTGGSAGALPGTVITLEEELDLSEEKVCMALWAAGAIGIILDTRATFAAEVAGCQVEIGAGGAMASAACVEASGGTVAQTLDAAAIAFQNTMGSVCDPIQGIVEIPCHTRNASAAAGAFVNADLIIGGYENDIPLDETVDAVFEVGKMLPSELRCTSLGGLSICPSALAMKRLR
ncbi:L-serine ammonia-lyase, iron-sulfur-dependent, subunit alpha [Synergistaceae bacterium OttesenSCG-928-I11]|nr:L-serine ammonia-lyase, iron-sulfur-dependent, subunit alpha [Synergistaceae bacterium OttesenSCG-928-I11]